MPPAPARERAVRIRTFAIRKGAAMSKQRDEKLYIKVFRELRDYILRHNLKPGDLIPTEMELCDKLGVSRNVLREAIKAMELMGIVTSRPGRGTAVCPFSLDFIFQNVLLSTADDSEKAILEMLNIRKKIELGYMHEVFRVLNYEHIRNLRENFDRFKERQENHLYTLDADHDFHMAMFAPLGNNTLITLLEAIWQVDAIFRPEEKLLFKPETIVEHEAILRALEEHNEEAFFAAMLSHFSMGKYAPAAGKPSLHVSAAD